MTVGGLQRGGGRFDRPRNLGHRGGGGGALIGIGGFIGGLGGARCGGMEARHEGIRTRTTQNSFSIGKYDIFLRFVMQQNRKNEHAFI